MSNKESKIATLAGGCFWCLEAVYEQVRGIEGVIPGYIGGHIPNPSYELICTGTTGHAEAVQLTFDPGIVSYREILELFFAIHDPTTRDYQGPDVGPQYRSVIFYHDVGQKATVEQVLGEMESAHLWNRPIVTEVVPYTQFYLAEEYHHRYYRRNSNQPYCQVVIAPKVAKFRKEHFDKLARETERNLLDTT